MSEVKLDKNTISQIKAIKKSQRTLENNIWLLVAGFMNGRNKDISKYEFNKDFTKLELIKTGGSNVD